MSDWRENARKGDWQLVFWEFLEEGEAEREAALRELWSMVKKAVTIEVRVNLQEKVLRHDMPLEVKRRAEDEAKRMGLSEESAKAFVGNATAAATILQNLSELFAVVPDWRVQSSDYLRQVLSELDAQDRRPTIDDIQDGSGAGASGLEPDLGHTKRTDTVNYVHHFQHSMHRPKGDQRLIPFAPAPPHLVP